MGVPFWKFKTLAQLTAREWESLCDSCGRCYLVKLQVSDSGKVSYTKGACKLLDIDACRCNDYANRKQRVADCFVLDAKSLGDYSYLPPTCAYHLLSEGKALPQWHPLITGDTDSVHRAGISVRGRVISEDYVHESELQECIVSWPLEVD